MNQVPQPGGVAMGENNLVVARYRNGQVVKGYTRDFFPDRPLFHVLPKGGQTAVPVKTAELKGVFFVRDLVGSRTRNKGRRFPAVDQGPQTGRRISVLFEDGELLVGYAQTYGPDKPGFFVYPADPQSNNLRAYVLRAATKQVKLGPAADELARTAPPPRQKPRPAA
ncbi:MAG: hypothetical protein ABI960_01535 [Candidatus Eisenbacteria bacterium]